MARTASSLLGLARFAFGGVAAPLICLGGGDDARGRDHARQAPSLRRPMTLACATEAL